MVGVPSAVSEQATQHLTDPRSVLLFADPIQDAAPLTVAAAGQELFEEILRFLGAVRSLRVGERDGGCDPHEQENEPQQGADRTATQEIGRVLLHGFL